MGEDGGDAEAAGVGDAEAGRGLSLGRAPDASRPLVVVDARSPERASLAERSVGLGAERRGKINRTFAAPPIGAPCAAGASLVRVRPARAFLQRPPPRGRPSEEKPRPSAVPRRRRVAVRRRVLGRTRGEPPVQNGRRGHRQRRSRAFEHYKRQAGRATHEAPARQARAVRRQVPNPRRRGPRGRGEARHRGRRREARGWRARRRREDPGGGARRRRRRRRRGGVRLDARGPRRRRDYRDAHGAWLAARRDHYGGGARRRRDEGPTSSTLSSAASSRSCSGAPALAEEAGPGDKLDDQEAFDKLEMERVAAATRRRSRSSGRRRRGARPPRRIGSTSGSSTATSGRRPSSLPQTPVCYPDRD